MAKFNLRNIPGWNYIEYGLARGLSGLLNLLPIHTATAIGKNLGTLVYWVAVKKRKVAIENLTIVFGQTLSNQEKEKLVLESFQNFVISVMEFFRIPVAIKDAQDNFAFEGTENLDKAFKQGKGLIFVISHLGSWENLAFLPFLRGYPCSVIVRPLKNPLLYGWIQKLREITRLRPIDRSKAVREIFARLRKNELVAILIDQWAGPDGQWIPFFSKETSTTNIPARLAQKTGCALVPGLCIRLSPGKYKIIIREAIPLIEGPNGERETTITLNQWLEKEIRNHSSQWIWGHQRWKPYSRYRANAQPA